MKQVLLSETQSVLFTGLKGYAGVYQDQANFQQADWAGLTSLWQTWTGIAGGGSVARYYAGTNYTYTTNLQEMVAAGVRIVVSFNPSYNPPSGADLADIVSLLAALKAAGADVIATVWHEPYYSGLTAAQYSAAVQFYAPAMRQYYPFWCCFSGNDTIESNGYYPGDQYVDGIAVDAYLTNSYNYSSNDLTNTAAMADNHSKALGIWEMGSTRGPNYLENLNGNNHSFSTTTGTWAGALNVASFFHSTILNPWGTQTGACAFTATAAGDMAMQSAPGANWATQMQACSAGDEITVGTWVQAHTVARSCKIGAAFYTSTGVFISTLYSTDASGAATDAVGSWTPVTGKVTAPASAAFWAANVRVTGTAAAGEEHFISMCYGANSTVSGHPQSSGTTWWEWLQGFMTGRLTANKPNGDVILFNAGMPGNSNMDAIQYSNDYRIGLWQNLYQALNNQVYAGSLAQYLGQGSCSVGPTGQGEVWNAGFTVSVHASSNVNEAICKIYCGDSVSPSNFVDGTTWGSTGDSSTNTPEIRTGQYVFAEWSGADSQSTGYLNVNGTRTVA